ncbi:hypothetical protein Ddye_031205 [Dipteronia dyeriana]|uniref:WAT1-related protein n=1 Tax=Dipteronia dyeriana TaxID=168575 RepID=A0AAD9TIU9_9ROSI|nr:hypothetical protein Ddye_031205 [Dipteronia dyeriana]
MELWSLKNLLPFIGMVVVILSQVSILQVMKAAMSKGKNKFAIMVYSNILSIFVLLVSCLIKHRSDRPPPLNFSTICKFFLLSLIGCSMQIFSYVGIEYSSPTLATAMSNLIPAFTFILALVFRMEKLNWRSKSSQAKSIGTIVAIAGAFVITFYKGPLLLKTFSGSSTTRSNWILGGFFLASDAFLSSTWYILQALILRNFTSVLILMLFTSFFGTILAAIFSLIVVVDSSAWNLKPDIGLVAVIYTAIVGSLFQSSLCAWCLSKKGPIYVTTFKPLAIVMSVVIGFLLLGDVLCLGSPFGCSLIGAIIIVAGFYSVMWGKAKEEYTIEHSEVGSLKSSSEKVPLLHNKIERIVDM